MTKKILSATLLFLFIAIMHNYAKTHDRKDDKQQKQRDKLEKAIQELPDSIFEDVKMEDLLMDEVYVKLAQDGWSKQEIITIMNTALKDRKAAKNKFGYGQYAKQWLPTFGYTPGGDTLYQFIDTTYNKKIIESVARTVPDDILNHTWKKEVYSPEDRKQGRRNPGYFRAVEHKPSSGRMHWGALHPEDPDKLYVIPDGAGIFKTDNCGKTWTCITDNIPVRIHRNYAAGYSIPVDPDNWNHLFAFMNGGVVYETTDGGNSWRQIINGTHKSFKRGYCFRDAEGTLKFIGAQQQGGINHWASKLWISEDTCKTWTEVVLPEELKDKHPTVDGKGFWFQSVEFDPKDRNRIYIPGSRSILYFDDGAKSQIVNGKKVYNIKKMEIAVYNQDRTAQRFPEDEPQNRTIFPLRADGTGHMLVNPENPDKMWFATGSRSKNASALYYSEDRGKTWTTLQEPSVGIGSGRVFGNEVGWNWLGGFGVNLKDPNWVYGCSMSSAISEDGGRNFKEFIWGTRIKSQQEDGKYYSVTNSRHNADNHFILSHKSGRVFRGSDGGMLVKDKNINDHQWTNIGGNMGQMLYYNIRVNEFGDQAMVGNTQDIDVQTYRYGRWGNWRGYEGSEASFNPYSGTEYYSGGGGGGIDNIGFTSWVTTTNMADVNTGSWYMQRTQPQNGPRSLYRIDDIGRTAVCLDDSIGSGINSFVLARGKEHTTVFVHTRPGNTLKKSEDGGRTFQDILANGQPAKFSNIQMAVDPDDSNILYLGQQGKVLKLYVNEGKFEDFTSAGLPNVPCDQLLFHEGSGDMYFLHKGSGIYILEKGSDRWRYWVKGYNCGDFTEMVINYTTQEMVICDYGRGVWVADLEHPSDRFFKNGFSLKEYSHKDGRRTIGIDTQWTIPLYYYYEWTVNGEKIYNPYQYLTRKLNIGDKVQLRLTLRESPDVSTLSAEYTTTETPSEPILKTTGNALYSNGKGRIDLGYMDFFFNDFTVDFWVKPMGNGVLLANRQGKNDVLDKGAKGWVLYIEGGVLKFCYSPRNWFYQPTYETKEDQQKVINGSNIEFGKWTHIAITEKRHQGQIRLYVNGHLVGEGERYLPEHTLNNAVCLSLFGDIDERYPIEATVDELKIWSKELPVEGIRREMFSANSENKDGLVAYYNFNGENLTDCKETFTQYRPLSRIRAEVRHEKMIVPACARLADYHELSQGEHLYESQGNKIMRLRSYRNSSAPFGVYAYNAEDWMDDNDNLDPKYHNVTSTGFLIHHFGTAEFNDTLDIEFHANGENFLSNKKYRLYLSDSETEKAFWSLWGELDYDATTQTFRASRVPWSEIADKKMVIVSMKPAIEVTVEGLSTSGELTIYDEAHTLYNMEAHTLENLTEPLGLYEIISDSCILQPQNGFYFTRGEAEAQLKVDLNQLDTFNKRIRTYLRGKDEKMIPMPVDVVNRITPRELGNSILIEKGGVSIGNGTDYAALNNSNTITLMGWVRIDDATALSGTRPLIFFRSTNPSATTGLHLENGNLRCHWNDEPWSWNTTTPFRVTAEDLGKWIHFALVARPDGMDYYMNGMKHTVNRTISKGRVLSMLMLGQNRNGETWFSGAFDQIGVWNRSLTQDEVIKYMQERVLMNDSALVAYVTMDYMDADGNLRESVNGLPFTKYGKVTELAQSIVPFNPVNRTENWTEEHFSLTFPNGKEPQGYVSTFRGHPYNYFSKSHQENVPLNKEYYTVVYKSTTALTANDYITLDYSHASILAGDSLSLGIRELGTAEAFTRFAASQATTNGSATFRIPGNWMAESAELMFFVKPSSGKRPVKVEMQLTDGTGNGSNYMLKENESTIPVQVKVISGNADDMVTLVVKESEYARLDKEQVDMRNGENLFTILIDRERIDKMGLNPVTVNIAGADAGELKFNVYLEPKVELRLKNGTDGHSFTATSPIATLDVEAELLEGYLENDVELSTTADLNTSMNIANGTLLFNQPVTIYGMEHYVSVHGETHEGWNLIGNPYLANINLTKHQNVSFDPQKVTKFVYQYDAGLNNYISSDMTDYDEEQKILPFQSFFVQTLEEDAELTITPVAKQTVQNRKTLDYYTAEELNTVQLRLYMDGKEQDRTTLRWESGSSPEFVVNEDASKLWSLSAQANQLYSLTQDQKATSINCMPKNISEVPVGLNIGTPGDMELRLHHMNGFNEEDQIILTDRTTGNEQVLDSDGNVYKFNIGNAGNIKDRFILKVKRASDANSIEGVQDAADYRVYAGTGTCTVTNLKGNAQIYIYDTQGRMVIRKYSRDEQFTTAVTPGNYIVKIRENGKDYVTKIMVK